MILFWLFLAAPAVLYVCGDVMDMDFGLLSKASQEERFVVTTVMILLTLALVPLSLRLFKFRRVAEDLIARKEKALRKWGKIRMTTLGLLLFGNTLLYYLYGFEPAFGYLALVVLLTMPFVFPTMGRCIAETEPESEPEPEPEPELQEEPVEDADVQSDKM